jgi:acetylornithine aminotransferase
MGYHVLTRLSHPSSVAHVADVSAHLMARLQQLPKWFSGLVQPKIRGRGLILGIGFHDAVNPGRVVSLARERGLFVLPAGSDAVRLVPSLIITRGDVDLAVDVLEGCLGVLSERRSGFLGD